MNEESQTEDETAKLDFKSVHIDKEWKHDAPLIGCRFDPSGRFVFSTSMDQNLQRWNLEDGQKVALSGHESWLRAIGFSKDGNRAFTAGYDGRLCFWDNESQSTEPLKTIDAHHGWVRWLFNIEMRDFAVFCNQGITLAAHRHTEPGGVHL